MFDAKLCSWPESNQWPVSVRSSSLSGGVTLYQLSYRNTRKNPLRSQFIHQTVFCLLCMPTLLWLWNHERKQCYNVTNIGQRESILVSDRALVLRSRSYKQSTFFLGFHVFFLRRFEWFLKCLDVTLVRIYYLIVCLMQNYTPNRNRTDTGHRFNSGQEHSFASNKQ